MGLQKIKVIVRVRPQYHHTELTTHDKVVKNSIIRIKSNKIILINYKKNLDLSESKINQYYIYDDVIDKHTNNIMIFNKYIDKMIDHMIYEKKRFICFCYGQTGSGKTYTIMGKRQFEIHFQKPIENDSMGLFPLSLLNILNRTRLDTDSYVYISIIEIYSENVYDLLTGKRIMPCIVDNHVKLPGLNEYYISTESDFYKLYDKILKKRKTGKTYANDNSSRSHIIFKIILKRLKDVKTCYFADLAGNERARMSNAKNRKQFAENEKINHSLFVLKECIRRMYQNNTVQIISSIPYRNSKLTFVLSEFKLTTS